MTDKNKCELVCIIDKSGSMHGLISETVSGYNQFIASQKELGKEMRVTTVLFHHSPEYLCERVLLDDAPLLSGENYCPGGTTALYDAIGNTVTTVGKALSMLPENERPGKVLVTIITDGLENASSEYNRGMIKTLVGEQQDKYSWEFVFLAANQDAVLGGAQIGVSADSCINFVATGQGVRRSYKSASLYASAAFADDDSDSDISVSDN